MGAVQKRWLILFTILFVLDIALIGAGTYRAFFPISQTPLEKRVEILWQAKSNYDDLKAEIVQERAEIAVERGELKRERESLQKKLAATDHFCSIVMSILDPKGMKTHGN